VRAIAVSESGIVVGTQKGSIFKLDTPESDPRMLVTGHFDGELWGLCADPTNAGYFATAGEDNQIMLWHADSKRFLASCTISDKKVKSRKRKTASTTSKHPEDKCARAVAYSPNSPHLAVGTNMGHVVVVDLSQMKVIADHDINDFGKRNVKNQKGNWIQTMSYSPDGGVLAVGTHGSVIVLMDVADGYKPAKKALKSHNAGISHLDWSADGTALQTNCIGYELLFHNIDRKNLSKSKQNPSGASQFKDLKWASQHCAFGWPTLGIFDPDADGSDVNCVDRDEQYSLLVTGDDNGKVNLFHYPCPEPDNERRIKAGHSSHVMNARFLKGGNTVITCGGDDKTIIQWKVNRGE
jgi:WD40 repeat protein